MGKTTDLVHVRLSSMVFCLRDATAEHILPDLSTKCMRCMGKIEENLLIIVKFYFSIPRESIILISCRLNHGVLIIFQSVYEAGAYNRQLISSLPAWYDST